MDLETDKTLAPNKPNIILSGGHVAEQRQASEVSSLFPCSLSFFRCVVATNACLTSTLPPAESGHVARACCPNPKRSSSCHGRRASASESSHACTQQMHCRHWLGTAKVYQIVPPEFLLPGTCRILCTLSACVCVRRRDQPDSHSESILHPALSFRDTETLDCDYAKILLCLRTSGQCTCAWTHVYMIEILTLVGRKNMNIREHVP